MKKKKENLMVVNGKKMWGLLIAQRDRRLRWMIDQDYIQNLYNKYISPINQKEKDEAAEALIFMNAYILSEIDGDFRELEKLVNVPKSLKKEIRDSKNAGQRDYINNYSDSQKYIQEHQYEEIEEEGQLGNFWDEMVERKKMKTVLRKTGKSIKEYKQVKKVEKPEEIPPVKILSKEEIEEVQSQYLNRINKKEK